MSNVSAPQNALFWKQLKKYLCILARNHGGDSQQVPPKDRRNYQGKYKTALQRHAINQTETGGPRHDSTRTLRDPNEAKNQSFLKVAECSNKIYTGQTGRFPVTSSRGYK